MRRAGDRWRAGRVVAGLLESVRALDSAAVRFDTSVSERLAEVQSAPAEIVAKAGAALHDAVDHVRQGMDKLAAAQGELAARAGVAVDVVDRHNQALESELARSRDNVAKVHSALVDMTGSLADRFDGKVA